MLGAVDIEFRRGLALLLLGIAVLLLAIALETMGVIVQSAQSGSGFVAAGFFTALGGIVLSLIGAAMLGSRPVVPPRY